MSWLKIHNSIFQIESTANSSLVNSLHFALLFRNSSIWAKVLRILRACCFSSPNWLCLFGGLVCFPIQTITLNFPILELQHSYFIDIFGHFVGPVSSISFSWIKISCFRLGNSLQNYANPKIVFGLTLFHRYLWPFC